MDSFCSSVLIISICFWQLVGSCWFSCVGNLIAFKIQTAEAQNKNYSVVLRLEARVLTMPAPVNPGRIERLEIENFKSYKGHQIVGPFKNFTAIIGPNGAGKYNLMDAISFVLGVRSMQLRGAQLKDLLYAYNDKDREQKGRKAYVKLVFITGNGEEMEFTRTITSSGSSEYRINPRTVTWDVYNNTMKNLGILVKARNFLVF